MIPFVKNPMGKDDVGTPLTFTALQDNSSVKLIQQGTPNTVNLYYKTSSSAVWSPYTIGTQIPLSEGQSVKFWNKSSLFSKDSSNYFQFVMAGRIAASGNTMSLLNFSRQATDYCFLRLFQGCTVLAKAPDLLATTLADSCYTSMFSGCISLIEAPVLPATALLHGAEYRAMFQNCSALRSAPALPATVLSGYCYSAMFQGCTSLTEAPELPVTVLASYCYTGMFYNCTSLTSAPALPATTLAESCYRTMFQGCTALTAAPELPATTLRNDCYRQMFYGCTSLVEAPELPATTLIINCYLYMFRDCTSLITAPQLPATVIKQQAYYGMFQGCTSLTEAPELPATTFIGTYNYYGMFYGCTSLTTAPALPATTLSAYCYSQMFQGCTALTTAPELPATTLADSCYNGMFRDCSNLVSIPSILPAIIMQKSCYQLMFSGCHKISKTPELPATTLAESCYSAMFSYCSQITTAPELPATILVANCYHSMFYGCPKLKEINVSFTDWNASNNATTNWVAGVAASGILIKPAQLFEERGASRIPVGWTVINKLAYLQSTGTQYIDTGVKPDYANGDSTSISFYRADYTGAMPCVFGSRESSLKNGFYALANNIAVLGSSSYTALISTDVRGDYTIAVNDDNILMNGEILDSMPERVSCAFDVTLFALNSSGSVIVYYSGMKLYDWKYYHNGVLAQHLVPALDANGVPCVYDIVSNTFKYNAGTGTFNYYPHLPAKRLSYLESTGTQYIDTGVKPDLANGDKVEISFYRASYTGFQPCVFGCREQYSTVAPNGFYVLPALQAARGAATVTDIPWSSTTKDYTIAVDDNNIMVDGAVFAAMPERVTCVANMFIFALNNGTSAPTGIYSGMKLYDWKYYHNGVLAQHLVPAMDQSDSVCLYDLVSDTYYYNAGTGTFNYGPRRLQYLQSTGTQYIDTGVKPDLANGDQIEIKFFGAEMFGEPKSLFGSRNVDYARSIIVNALYQNGSGITFADSNSYTGIPFNFRNEHVLTINDTEVIDNGNVLAQTPKHVSCDYSTFLFTMNNIAGMTLGIYPGMWLYYWKYRKNGVLSQQLVPMLDQAGVPCMYDTVTQTYYYNEGSGAFDYAFHVPARRLRYLQSTGTQYIDTGVKPDFANGDSIEIRLFNPSGNLSHFGSRQYTSTYLNSLYNIGGYIVFYGSAGSGSTIAWDSYTGEHVLSIDDTNIVIDGSILAATPLLVTAALPFFLFAFNENGQPHQSIASGMKLYSWKYWHNGKLMQYLIPALDTNNVPCMYDVISDTYYYNAGTGTFNYA